MYIYIERERVKIEPLHTVIHSTPLAQVSGSCQAKMSGISEDLLNYLLIISPSYYPVTLISMITVCKISMKWLLLSLFFGSYDVYTCNY